MARNTVDEWSTTPDENADIGGTNISEGCAPGNLNNGMRKVMAQIKSKFVAVANLGGITDLAVARGNLKIWTGNQAAYDAISAKDAQTIYFVTA